MTFYDMTWLERLLFLKRIKGGGSGHEETTTSNTFVTDMVAPLRKLLLSFAPKQSGSGDPSPTNVRPISGWNGVSVVVSSSQDAQDGQTYSVSWQTEAGTVYGGTLDMVSGVLTVDRAITTSPSWSLRDAGTSAPWIRVSGLSYVWDTSDRTVGRRGFMCNKARTAANSGTNVPEEALNYGIWAYDANTVRIYLPSGSGSADATAFMVDCQICYKLATPKTYQLTPQQINTLIGTNVITTDANVEEIIYLKKAE